MWFIVSKDKNIPSYIYFWQFPPKDIVMALYRYIHFSELSGTLDTNNLKNNLVNVKW